MRATLWDRKIKPRRNRSLDRIDCYRSCCADVYRHLPDTLNRGTHNVARVDWAHSLGRTAQEHVARQQSVKRGCKFDQLGNAEYQIARIGFLPQFAVDADLQVELRGSANSSAVTSQGPSTV